MVPAAGHYFLMNPRHWPKAVLPGKNALHRPIMLPDMLAWLETHVGQGQYGFKSYQPKNGNGPPQVFLGLRQSHDAFAFRMTWGGR